MNEESPTPNTSNKQSSHRMQTMARLSPMGRKLFQFIEFDDQENLLLEVRKHPVGLFWIITLGFGISLTILVAAGFLAQAIGNGLLDGSGLESGTAQSIVLLLGLVIAVLGIGITAIIAGLYVRDVIFITDQKIAEVVYVSLFHRRTNQLNIGNVEDVTTRQVGIFPRIFNYGSILIETAGEKVNPEFPYVPEPYKVSQVVIQAHEEYVRKHGN